MPDKKFFITAAIPYVNGRPHLGHALEFVQCDAAARFAKLKGFETLLISGSDENGLKIVRAAQVQNLTPRQLADKNTVFFRDLVQKLNIQIDVWRRGSDRKLHWPGTRKLWRLSMEKGDLYKKKYGGFYCVGCEDYYTKKQLQDGKCPEHLTPPEWVEEENYFFKLSRFKSRIEKLIASDEIKIIPRQRKNEIMAFIKSGLVDFSVSRSKDRAKNWGIPVPDDDSQVIYTWYDALNIYQTAAGFGIDDTLWKKWWPADVHVIGKGILRFHAVYWIGMLLSAGLPLPKSISVHGYITVNQQKMGKSLGNVIDPLEVIDKYGSESLRYYLLREIPSHSDGDFSFSRFEQLYNADLANGLGNLIARITRLMENVSFKPADSFPFSTEFEKAMANFAFDEALSLIWNQIRFLDRFINDKKPWTIKNKSELREILEPAVNKIREIAFYLQPFLPQTAEKIIGLFSGRKIKSAPPLYPRIR